MIFDSIPVIYNGVNNLLFVTTEEEIIPPCSRLNDKDNHFVIGSLSKDLFLC